MSGDLMHSPKLGINLLGPFRVDVDGIPVDGRLWSRRSAKLLVKLLALQPHFQLHREEAMEFLWPESSPESAANNVYKALHAARRALEAGRDAGEGPVFLLLRGQQLALTAPGGVRTDVQAFEQTASDAFHTRDLDAFQRAADLYTGDLLIEDPYAEWAFARRDHLRSVFGRVLSGLAQCAASARLFDRALGAVERILALDPTDEDAHRLAMSLHAQTGNQAAALRQFETCRTALRREFDVEPDAETAALHRKILRGRIEPAPPETSRPPERDGPLPEKREPHERKEPARASPLPSPATSFVGRTRELVEAARLLAETRLLTVTGIGGIGKTRFAIELAASLADSFDDGARLVELGAIADPAFVVRQIATSAGIDEQANQPLLATVCEALQPRSLLLVLDNCEHVAEACAGTLSEILKRCPNVRVLATSREPLRVRGETFWTLPQLDTPITGERTSVDHLLRHEAVRLFVERARQNNPRFALGDRNAESVASLCRKLDGIPLAIELAAARVRALSVEQILERLDNRLQILKPGAAHGQQRTLHASLDWGYEHLLETERMFFRRLSVFAGGWTLDAAETICAGEGLEAEAILDLLTCLIEKSLVAAAVEESGARYRMLEPIRQYALEKLERAGETPALAASHRRWFVRLAAESEARLKGTDQADWMDLLDNEHENFRAALAARDASGEPEDETLQLAGALAYFWVTRGYWSEGFGWLKIALGAREKSPARVVARGLHGAGILAQRLSKLGEASALLEESLAMRRSLGDESGMAETLGFLGYVALRKGNAAEARARLDEALALARSAGDRWTQAFVCNQIGSLAHSAGDGEAAISAFERSLKLFGQEGDRSRMASALNNTALVEMSRGNAGRAVALYREALELLGARGDRKTVATVLNNLGVTLSYQGDYAQAQAMYEQSLAIARAAGDKSTIAFALGNSADAAVRLGDLDRAEAHARESRERARESEHLAVQGDSTRILGHVAVCRGDLDLARALLGEAAGMLASTTSIFGLSQVLDVYVLLACEAGDHRTALRLYGAAARLREETRHELTGSDRHALDDVLARISREEPPASVERLLAEGKSLTVDEALAIARNL